MYEFAVTPAVTSIRRRGVAITGIAPDGIGAEFELEAGDRIIKVNGRVVRDYLDFRFQTGGETELVIEVRKQSGEDWELQIERDEGEDLGLTFEQIVPRQCANECIFCFCKGNPQDARPSLFIRDEDVRLSFLYGNYTTLTSITEDEMQRIVEQRLTPQYVSVHATDLDVRAYLLASKERADISEKLRRLLDAGIEVHAQVVLCPRINDGEILRRTIFDLAAHFPRVSSVAIVPLGLTRYNTDERLTAVTPEFCQQTIKEVSEIQAELQNRLGTTFAFLGDEIYLRAGVKVPGRKHYGDYPQIEDGIGMVRAFCNEFAVLLRRLNKSPYPRSSWNDRCGNAVRSARRAVKLAAAARARGRPVKNDYFGGDVSVAGLLTGGDIVAANDEVWDFCNHPQTTLKSDEEICWTADWRRGNAWEDKSIGRSATFANLIRTTAYSK